MNNSLFTTANFTLPLLHACRVILATWNVGGKTPNDGLNLQDFLRCYMCRFQEIVRLTADNVLVLELEDNEPAARWLAVINQAPNNPEEQSSSDEPAPAAEPTSADVVRHSHNCPPVRSNHTSTTSYVEMVCGI